MSKPKFSVGERVIVRCPVFNSDDALITEIKVFPKGEPVVQPDDSVAYIPQDMWLYKFDCSPPARNGNGLTWVLERDVYPKHDGSEDFDSITEFMDSLKTRELVT